MCGQVFFAAEQGPFAAHDPTEDELLDFMYDPGPATVGWPAWETSIHYLCDLFCGELGLSLDTSRIVEQMAEELDLSLDIEDHTPRLIVSTTLYMATHILNEHRSLGDISRVSSTQAEDIRRAYRRIYPTREQLIQPHMLRGLNNNIVQDFLNHLPAPNIENGFMNHEEAGIGLEHYVLVPSGITQREFCHHCCDALGFPGGIRNTCSQLAGKIQGGPYLAGRSSLPIVAVSLFMISHLMYFETTIKQISDVVGISEGTIRDAYRSVYPWRGEVVEYGMVDDIRRQRFLQNITWPAI